MGLMEKLFGTYSEKQLKLIAPIADRVEALAPTYANMTDDELRGMTDVLKGRLAKGETLDDILPDAFATVREADWRVLGKRPFHVQVIGGIVLHQGRIAEMKTGEGKTLVATMPAYLNALAGNGVHIVTVNDYLARRDSDEMGRVYAFLGLTTGLVVHGQSRTDKKAAYLADITYGTNNEYGFDYLRDNMAVYKEQMVQRGHAFAIVDEVDSILIDEARTPLIISGAGDKSSELYEKAEKFARGLTKFVIKEMDDKQDGEHIREDYVVDEKAKTAVLTRHGIEKAERYFGLENLSDPENSTIVHHINQAIRAHGIMHREEDYVVKDGQVVIVDDFTGRLMPGRRYNNGLHQALEAKEGVKVEKESKTIATITFQNYFRMYHKLSGMTGTAGTEEAEFRDIYRLDVVVIPTNKPMIRKDHNDRVYTTRRGKYMAILQQIKACHEKGQPVLVGTITIDKSEELSRILKMNGIPHTVLNAKHHEREAEIVAQAGKRGAVTVSTNMAGRGTDILLGGNPDFMAKAAMRKDGMDEDVILSATGTQETEDPAILEARGIYQNYFNRFQEEIEPEREAVVAAGGLFILGTERHESRRIDNQLRGRSGRQGDPGESCFYLSLEDDLMRLFGSERIMGMVQRLGLPEDTPINAKILSGSIEKAQRNIEGSNYNRRKNVITYDDVMNIQREIIYKQRSQVLNGENVQPLMENMITEYVSEMVDTYVGGDNPQDWNLDALRAALLGVLTLPGDFINHTFTTPEEVKEMLLDRAMQLYRSKDALFPDGAMREVERVILLRNVDSQWMDHIDAMDELKGIVGLNAYAQRDPVNEYRVQGADMFDEMVFAIKEQTVRGLLTVRPTPQPLQRKQVATPTTEGLQGSGPVVKRITVVKKEKVGPNDPCPCGSGKKYKKCCGLGGGD